MHRQNVTRSALDYNAFTSLKPFIGRTSTTPNNTPAARRYASAVFSRRRVSVRPSVTRRYCTKTAKRIGSRKQRRTIVQELYSFLMPKINKHYRNSNINFAICIFADFVK